MGKNMNLIPSLLHKEIWLWPSCNHPKTPSFRATTHNSVYLVIDPSEPSLAKPEAEPTTTLDSCFTNSSESASTSTDSDHKYLDSNEYCSSPHVEAIVRGARSERLFFEPDPSSSILESSSAQGSGRPGGLPYKESFVMEMESDNPYGDFKKSMEEMVQSLGLKDWDRLEELLRWYLRMNVKNNHQHIVGAFLDLLFNGGGPFSDDHSTASFLSAASTFSSPISSPSSQVGQGKMVAE